MIRLLFVGLIWRTNVVASVVIPMNVAPNNNATGQMIGPTIAGVLMSFTQSYNAALIGAASVVLIGAMLLIGGIRFDRKLEISLIK